MLACWIGNPVHELSIIAWWFHPVVAFLLHCVEERLKDFGGVSVILLMEWCLLMKSLEEREHVGCNHIMALFHSDLGTKITLFDSSWRLSTHEGHVGDTLQG